VKKRTLAGVRLPRQMGRGYASGNKYAE